MYKNAIDNNALTSLINRAAPGVVNAIKTASARTGVNFAYLMEQAAAESSFDSKAKARTSSATGLYQFIESTWLSMVKRYGDKHGLGAYAEKISDSGRVSDRAMRKEILELRKDPEKAAAMAAELAAENQRFLERKIGGDIGSTELYLAHFLGASGAAGFLDAYRNNPLDTAAHIFPRAAKANYNVFYDSKTGKARTLAGVYEFFSDKFQASENTAPIQSAKVSPSLPIPEEKPERYSAERYVMKPFGSDRPSYGSGWRAGSGSGLMVSPAEIMLMAQMETPSQERHFAAQRARHPYSYNQ